MDRIYAATESSQIIQEASIFEIGHLNLYLCCNFNVTNHCANTDSNVLSGIYSLNMLIESTRSISYDRLPE